MQEKPLTLDEFTKTILTSQVNKLANDLLTNSQFLEYFDNKYKPTRKERFKWWIEDKKQRAKDIWTILNGGNIHENCGDY